jgi:hypothetical protein
MRTIQFVTAFLFAFFAKDLSAQPEKIQTSPSLTEAHTIIGMQYFVVGTLAKECQTLLNKSDAFVKETQSAWLSRNTKFVDALTKYQTLLFVEIESKFGKDKLASEKMRYRDIVVAQGTAIVRQFFAKGDKLSQCQKAAEAMTSTYFDITPRFPLYSEALKLVEATSQ